MGIDQKQSEKQAGMVKPDNYEGFSLNPDLDVPALSERFRTNGGRLQIQNILAPESAELVYRTLVKETPWGTAFYEDGARFLKKQDVEAMGAERFRTFCQQQFQKARGGYHYLYYCYPILQAYLEGWAPGHRLMRFLEFMNTEPVLDLIRSVTDIRSVMKADAQATCYGPNHFLLQHSDQFDEEYWRIAYVFGFTKNWNPDWGGYLQFFDERGDITQAFMPRFNVLNIFAVPQPHSVGLVAPFSAVPRLSITGWFRDQ